MAVPDRTGSDCDRAHLLKASPQLPNVVLSLLRSVVPVFTQERPYLGVDGFDEPLLLILVGGARSREWRHEAVPHPELIAEGPIGGNLVVQRA